MKNALIVHGAFGAPNENWIPWLRSRLERAGYDVVVPIFPTPEGQNLENWMKIVSQTDLNFNDETVLVGHSIGATFLLSLLEKHAVCKAVLVSGFIDRLGDPAFDDINMTFFENDFNWQTIRDNAEKIVMFHGTNDPYVPMSVSQRLGEKLGVSPVMVADGGALKRVRRIY